MPDIEQPITLAEAQVKLDHAKGTQNRALLSSLVDYIHEQVQKCLLDGNHEEGVLWFALFTNACWSEGFLYGAYIQTNVVMGKIERVGR